MPDKKAPVSITPYLDDLKNPDYKIRSEAVRQLSKSRNPEAVEYLIQALNDKTVAVKRLAIRGLGKLKDTRTIEPLIPMMDASVCNVHRPAYQELIRFGDAAVPALIDALRHHKSDEVRRMAAYCLGEIKSSDAVLPLIDALRDTTEPVAVGAAQALQVIVDERAREPLAQLLQQEPETRSHVLNRSIALALAWLGDSRAIPTLEESYNRFPNLVIALSSALSQIRDRRVIPILEKMAASPDEIHQECARSALQRLGFLDDLSQPSTG